MTPHDCLTLAIRPACALLGPAFVSPEADVLLLAIALQESTLAARRQFGTGPARGYWQFEQIAVQDVLTRARTKPHAKALLDRLTYSSELTPAVVHAVLEHHDILAAGVARLNLRNSPHPLPRLGDVDDAWTEYLGVWRPGKPRRDAWDAHYEMALETVDAAPSRVSPVDTTRLRALLDELRALLAVGVLVIRVIDLASAPPVVVTSPPATWVPNERGD